MERQESSGHSPRGGDRDRCFPGKVGSLLSEDPHWRPVVRGGAEPPHQRTGAASHSVCSESFTETCQRCQRAAKE